MKIFERNRQKPTRRNRSYVAKAFALLQPKMTFFRPDNCFGKASQ